MVQAHDTQRRKAALSVYVTQYDPGTYAADLQVMPTQRRLLGPGGKATRQAKPQQRWNLQRTFYSLRRFADAVSDEGPLACCDADGGDRSSAAVRR
jgi:hypothetical protein